MTKHRKGQNKKVVRKVRRTNPTNNVTRNVHYPTLAHQHHVKLNYTQRNTTATAKGTVGLVHYMNNTPLYMDAFYQMYTYSKILAVDVTVEAVNLDTTPYEIVMAVMPQGTIASTTNDQAKQSPGAIVKILGGSSSQNRATLKKHYNAEQLVGYHLADRDTRMNFSDANSSSYPDTSLPAVVFYPSLITGASTLGVSLTVIVTYHVCFFDLYVPATSALTVKRTVGGLWPPEPGLLTEEEEERSLFVEDDEQDISSLNIRVINPKTRPAEVATLKTPQVQLKSGVLKR